jgi:HSP20 family protein
MANLIRKEKEQTPARTGQSAWDPFRIMESMLEWDPFSSLAPSLGTGGMQSYMPRFDVKETQDRYTFTADLPGIKEDDLNISLTGNRLVISGKREAEESKEEGQYHLYERSYGQFSRSFSLPEGVNSDEVSAHLKDGVLTVTVGKKPEVQPKRIQLSGKAAASS